MLKNPGPKNPFTIGERQLHNIDSLETLFNNIQPQQKRNPFAKLVPKEVPLVAYPRVSIIVPSLRVPMTVELSRVR